MVNQDEKLFYLSGLFSISFFLVILSTTLYYSYKKNLILQVRTDNAVKIDLYFQESPKKEDKPKVVEKKNTLAEQPKPTPMPPKKEIPKIVEKKIEEVKTPDPVKPPPAPSLDSLFSKIDTSKFSNEESETEEEKRPKVSSDVISRLKSSISKTELPLDQKRIDENLSDENYRVERKFRFDPSSSPTLDYRELEITSSDYVESDKGVYDKLFSQIKSFLHDNWYPSNDMAGNSAIVRIILNNRAVFEHYKIITRGKNEEFNIELDRYLDTLLGEKVPVDIKNGLSFEVKFRAKE
jgi:outer membrane biosynthesis protein TonB